MEISKLFKKKNIPAKKTWNDITLGTFLKIKEYMECKDEYTMLNILSAVYPDVDFEDFTLQDFALYQGTLDFMNNDIPRNKIKKRYTVNGKVYDADFDLTKVNISQFIDYWNYNRKDERKHEELLSVFFVPEGHKYNDGYDIQQVKNDILYLKMPDVQAMIFFFMIQSKELQIVLSSCLKDEMLKLKETLTEQDQ